ncbi:MAG TPA: hypothetical protein PLM79_11305 [Syntrophobacteraceae bacterium]|nr:hypothetical protein [Syntrophobacteraceae bacterium]
MAEIKSTLELILEKTRHMTLTEEEKKEQARADLLISLRVLVQKYQNGVLSLRDFASEYDRVRSSSREDAAGLLREELFRQLDPQKDNTSVLTLLGEICSVAVSGITAVLDESREAVSRALEERTKHKLEELRNDRGISGSAVLPNLEADPRWKEDRERIRDDYALRLARECARLTP